MSIKKLKTVCFYRKDARKFAYVHIYLNEVTDKIFVVITFRRKYERAYYLLERPSTFSSIFPEGWAMLADMRKYKQLIALDDLSYSECKSFINNTLTDCKSKYIIREV